MPAPTPRRLKAAALVHLDQARQIVHIVEELGEVGIRLHP